MVENAKQQELKKASNLPDWHDDEDDEYDEEDDGVEFGQDPNQRKQQVAKPVKQAVNDSASKTQNSSAGKDGPAGQNKDSDTVEKQDTNVERQEVDRKDDDSRPSQSQQEEPEREMGRPGGFGDDRRDNNRGNDDGFRRQDRNGGVGGYGQNRYQNDRRQGGGGYDKPRRQFGEDGEDRRDGGYQGGYNRDRGDRGERSGYNNRNYDRDGGDRENRGGYNQNRNRDNYRQQPTYERFDKDAINPESNYRLYYQNDPQFFSLTIDEEEAPFNFKIHLFQGAQRGEGEEPRPPLDQREEKTKMMEFLQSFEAQRVDMQPIFDRTGRGNDKLRVLFEINDKDKAKALYEMVGVHKQNHLPNSEQWMQIYFLLQEQKFEQYADVAASKYVAEEEVRQKEQAERRAAERQNPERNQRGGAGRDDRGPRQKGRYNDRHQQANETGIKFGGSGPPKFTSSKPGTLVSASEETEQADASHRQVTYNDPAADQDARMVKYQEAKAAPTKKYQQQQERRERRQSDNVQVQGQGEQVYDGADAAETDAKNEVSEQNDQVSETAGSTNQQPSQRGGRGGRGGDRGDRGGRGGRGSRGRGDRNNQHNEDGGENGDHRGDRRNNNRRNDRDGEGGNDGGRGNRDRRNRDQQEPINHEEEEKGWTKREQPSFKSEATAEDGETQQSERGRGRGRGRGDRGGRGGRGDRQGQQQRNNKQYNNNTGGDEYTEVVDQSEDGKGNKEQKYYGDKRQYYENGEYMNQNENGERGGRGGQRGRGGRGGGRGRGGRNNDDGENAGGRTRGGRGGYNQDGDNADGGQNGRGRGRRTYNDNAGDGEYKQTRGGGADGEYKQTRGGRGGGQRGPKLGKADSVATEGGDRPRTRNNADKPNMSFKSKKQNSTVDATTAQAADKTKITKQASNVSSSTIKSTNRFAAFEK